MEKQVKKNVSDEQRSYVRGKLSFRVKFRVISMEEYEALRGLEGEIFSPWKEENGADIINTLEQKSKR